MKIQIRPERAEDYGAIRAVNDAAFGQPNEGRLVEALRQWPDFIPELSLVAAREGEVVGHILFSGAPIVEGEIVYPALALAPMAVLPGLQGRGIGSRLVEEGLKRARALGHALVTVVGHPKYYPRFGFVSAAGWGIKCPFPVPEEAFMVLELKEGVLEGTKGTVRFPPPFEEV